ncbi:hypothetical protein G6F32_014218 [Rhizopus arrhizus]|nr:hypothetical protein G6F32_014218 [Rhizopus arrhizus]
MAALGMGRAGWLAGAAVRHQHDALVHGRVAAIQDHLQRDAANAKLVQPGAQILGLGTGHHLQFEGRAGRAGQGSGQNQAAGPQCWVQHRSPRFDTSQRQSGPSDRRSSSARDRRLGSQRADPGEGPVPHQGERSCGGLPACA